MCNNTAVCCCCWLAVSCHLSRLEVLTLLWEFGGEHRNAEDLVPPCLANGKLENGFLQLVSGRLQYLAKSERHSFVFDHYVTGPLPSTSLHSFPLAIGVAISGRVYRDLHFSERNPSSNWGQWELKTSGAYHSTSPSFVGQTCLYLPQKASAFYHVQEIWAEGTHGRATTAWVQIPALSLPHPGTQADHPSGLSHKSSWERGPSPSHCCCTRARDGLWVTSHSI
jgi:hypothetical protein